VTAVLRTEWVSYVVRRGRHYRPRRHRIRRLAEGVAVAIVSAATVVLAITYLLWDPQAVYATVLGAPAAAPQTVLYGAVPAGVGDLTVSVALCPSGVDPSDAWPDICTPVASTVASDGAWRLVITSCSSAAAGQGCKLWVKLQSSNPSVFGTRAVLMRAGTARELSARVIQHPQTLFAIFLGATY
jgi:hypothetical protein